MHLRLITELRFGRASKRVQDLLARLPGYKRKHSLRVGKALHKAGVKKVGIYGGLLHDVLERGVDPRELVDHATEYGLPPEVVKIVHALSNDETIKVGDEQDTTNQTLVHLKHALASIKDKDIRNIVILCKLADRTDNLYQRLKGMRGKKLGRRYAANSGELVDFLRSQYTGPWKPMRKLLNAYHRLMS